MLISSLRQLLEAEVDDNRDVGDGQRRFGNVGGEDDLPNGATVQSHTCEYDGMRVWNEVNLGEKVGGWR